MWKSILKTAGGAISTGIDQIGNEFEYRANQLDEFRDSVFGTAGPDSWERQTADTVQKAIDVSPLGRAEQGAVILGGNTAETVGLPRPVGEFVGGALAPGFATTKAVKAPSPVTRATAAATVSTAKTAVKEAIEGVDTIGRGGPPTPQLATAGITPQAPNFDGGNVTLAPQVMELTATRNLAPGVEPGIGSSDDYAEGVKNLRKTQDYYRKKRITDKQLFEAGKIDEAALQRRNAKTKKMEDAKLSTLPTPDDPDIFEKIRYKNQDPTSEYKYLDQHHGSGSKAMTAPWVQTAMAIGDNDDVVALFELHRSIMGSGMGNAKSAIIDAPTVVHNTANASKSGRNVKEAIHSFMKKGGAGIEIPTEEVLKIIGKPKDMDELLDRYVVFVNEYLLPQKELSLKAVRQEFARHRATLTPDKIDEFDKFVSEINMANTDITQPMQ